MTVLYTPDKTLHSCFKHYINMSIKHSSNTNKQVFKNNYMLKELFTRTQMSQIALLLQLVFVLSEACDRRQVEQHGCVTVVDTMHVNLITYQLTLDLLSSRNNSYLKRFLLIL